MGLRPTQPPDCGTAARWKPMTMTRARTSQLGLVSLRVRPSNPRWEPHGAATLVGTTRPRARIPGHPVPAPPTQAPHPFTPTSNQRSHLTWEPPGARRNGHFPIRNPSERSRAKGPLEPIAYLGTIATCNPDELTLQRLSRQPSAQIQLPNCFTAPC